MLKSVQKTFKSLKKHQFLFEELVKRDFKHKYKDTYLGMVWSVLNPLLTLLVMKLVFTQFFGRNAEHYTIYLFSGTLLWSFYKESTSGGMNSLSSNAGIIKKVNVPKYLFLLSKNVSTLVNFVLSLCVYFIYCVIDRIHFGPHMLLLLFPILFMLIMNIGIGLILSSLSVFFKDINYLYGVFCTLLHYLSGIFYYVDNYDPLIRNLFLINPVYCFIKYVRTVVISEVVPPLYLHLLCVFYAGFYLVIGAVLYKKFNHKFIYYL